MLLDGLSPAEAHRRSPMLWPLISARLAVRLSLVSASNLLLSFHLQRLSFAILPPGNCYGLQVLFFLPPIVVNLNITATELPPLRSTGRLEGRFLGPWQPVGVRALYM